MSIAPRHTDVPNTSKKRRYGMAGKQKSSSAAKKARKPSGVKDLPPKNAGKVRGGDSYQLLSSITKSTSDTNTTIIKNI
jgi:hypothetical protein